MAVWHTAHTMRWSTKAVIAAALVAALFVVAVPVALFVGVILMILGHVVGGFALFGASILAAVAAVTIASMSGVRHLRKMVTQVTQRGDNLFTQQDASLFTQRDDDLFTQRDDHVVRLSRGEYSYE
jgi:uncharacterized membrane protein YdjX (TVP38/TMEM64 family)